MNAQVLAQNIKRLRVAKKLSQKALAEGGEMSLSAVKNLEGGRGEPRMNTIQAIARELGVKLQDLFLPVRQLKTVRFRSQKRMQNRENILADVARWLDDFNFLEDLLELRLPFRLKSLTCGGGNRSGQEIATCATACRSALSLGPEEPIHDICGLLEHAGIKLYPLSSSSDGFFGLCLGEEDGGPAVIVNTRERISVERRIFSAAHELGHLMLHSDSFDIDRIEENQQEEKEADIFAGHFLMPDMGFKSQWNEFAGLPWVERILRIKRIFNVSYKTVLVRLVELKAEDDGVWKKFNIAYQRRYRRKLPFRTEPKSIPSAEPFGLREVDFLESRFSRLTRQAVEEDRISFSRGAEILRISVNEMKNLMESWGGVL